MSIGYESAYPVQAYYRDDGELLEGPQPGLTKRELFAAMAMQGMFYGWPDGSGCTEICASAVHAADALLAELAKEVRHDPC